MIVGVTGFFAAGKDTFAACLQNEGFAHVSLSEILREELRARGIEVNIPNLTAVGNQLRREQGAGVLGRLAAKRFAHSGDAVVSSIRHPEEVRALREDAPDFTMVFLNAPQRVRFERSLLRRRDGDPQTFEDFCEEEERQLRSADDSAQQLLACREIADVEIENGASTEELRRQISELLVKLHSQNSCAGRHE
ncbi:hypothetical protein JXA32_09890 [Candidatus Sumerlaeota bacterium]|nr:hypothetical protein [Candidatus Sumerlaeota bacterium]